MTEKIQKYGGDYYLIIPDLLLEQVDIEETDEIDIQLENDCIVIRKV